MNTNLPTRAIKIFFIIYICLLLPHAYETFHDPLAISILLAGIGISILAHNNKYKLVAIIFLMLHMSLELPHMIEHHEYENIHIILLHGLHVIFDLILLYKLSKSYKFFIFFLGLIGLFGAIAATIKAPIQHEIEPFIIGGILGCIIIHLITLITKNKNHSF